MNPKNYGYDHETHHLIQIRQPPPSIIALREELPKHPDIYNEAIKGNTFEECIGIIAARLDVVLDGLYDPEPLCAMLVDVLRKRHMFGSNPSLRHPDLVDVELVEREDSVEVVKRDRNVKTITPENTIITRSGGNQYNSHSSTSTEVEESTADNKEPPVSDREAGGSDSEAGSES